MLGVAGSLLIFRLAAVQPRFGRQIGWLLLAGTLGGTSLVLVDGFHLFSVLLIAFALWAVHCFLKPPRHGRYYNRPLYQSGYWFLFLVNWMVIRCEWAGLVALSILYILAYLASKLFLREYEAA